MCKFLVTYKNDQTEMVECTGGMEVKEGLYIFYDKNEEEFAPFKWVSIENSLNVELVEETA